MAKREYKNPIDPATGKRKRGRPPKVNPVDTLAGPQPTEQSVGEPLPDISADDENAITVRPLDPKDRAWTELSKKWKEKFKGTHLMAIPEELQKKYPEGDFCWARNTKECISTYRTTYGYEPVQADKPLPGQTDTNFYFGDAVLMVRPGWMRKVHDQANRERVVEQTHGSSEEGNSAEQEALREARSMGYDQKDRALRFFSEDRTQKPTLASGDSDIEAEYRELKQEYAQDPKRPKGAKGRQSKYWGGGIPS